MMLTFVALLLCSFAALSDQCSHEEPCTFADLGGEPFVPLKEEVSSGGTLDITLNVEMADFTVHWLTLHRRTWNGEIPGRVWRIRTGDVVTVKVVNNLQLPHKHEAINEQRLPNTTNMHTHGLHISSKEPQDNVFVHIQPTEQYTYRYEICPEQPAGTYWYHPHLHGSTLFQVHSGMSGMIVVEDQNTAATPDHLLAVSCPDNCQHEVRLLFQPILMYRDAGGRGFAATQRSIQDNDMFRHAQYSVNAGGTLEEWLEANVDYMTTNGQLWPTLSFPAGQVKRFRMVNANGGALLELHIVNQGQTATTSGCTVSQISLDGIYFDEAAAPRLGKTLLVPSAKADWLVVCNTPGTYELRSTRDNADDLSIGGFPRYNEKLLILDITGSAASTTLETTLPAREDFVGDLTSLTQDQVTGRFVIEASPGTRLNREKFSSQTDYRFKMELDTVQEWYLTNSDPTAAHPIHIHVNHAQVQSYNPYTGPYAVNQGRNYVFFAQDDTRCYFQHSSYTGNENVNAPNNPLRYLGHDQRWATLGTGTLGYSPRGTWQDVFLVPPLVNITIRFKVHKFTGEVVIHCHLLNHEDAGMMMTVDIVEAGSDLTANTQSGNAYPGQCAQCDAYPFNKEVICIDGTTSTTTTTTTTTTTLASNTSSTAAATQATEATTRSSSTVFSFSRSKVIGMIALWTMFKLPSCVF